MKSRITTGGLRALAAMACLMLLAGVQAQVSLEQLARNVVEDDKGVATSQNSPSQESTGSTSATGGATPDMGSWSGAIASNQFKTPENSALQRSEGSTSDSNASELLPLKPMGASSSLDRPSEAEYRQGVQYMSGLNFGGEDPERAQTRRQIAIGIVSFGGILLLGFGVRRAFFPPKSYH